MTLRKPVPPSDIEEIKVYLEQEYELLLKEARELSESTPNVPFRDDRYIVEGDIPEEAIPKVERLISSKDDRQRLYARFEEKLNISESDEHKIIRACLRAVNVHGGKMTDWSDSEGDKFIFSNAKIRVPDIERYIRESKKKIQNIVDKLNKRLSKQYSEYPPLEPIEIEILPHQFDQPANPAHRPPDFKSRLIKRLSDVLCSYIPDT
jgi:hypothetical protein